MYRTRPRVKLSILLPLALLATACAGIRPAGVSTADPGRLVPAPDGIEGREPRIQPGASTESADVLEELTGRPVAFEVVAEAQQSGMLRPMTLAIETQQQLDTVWADLHADSTELVDKPQIDFATEILLAVYAGRKPTAGYEPEILRVQVEGESLVAYYTVTAPDPEQVVAQVVTSPFQMVSVPPFDSFVQFETIDTSSRAD